MIGSAIFAITGSVLVGLGLYGVVMRENALHRILAFNILGGGIFMVFGFAARRGAGAGFAADPVPQALVITGVVVAFSATALATAIVVRLAAAQAEEGDAAPHAKDDG